MSAPVGLGTYAFFWRHAPSAPDPWGLDRMLEATAERGIGRFQICDWAPMDEMSDSAVDALSTTAGRLGIALELGTRGTAPERLDRYLRLAIRLRAPLVRTMVTDMVGAIGALEVALPDWERAGVTLALETYELVRTDRLVDLVETVGSPFLGICLDPANCVAALEHPVDVIRRCAPHTVEVHVKDFAFTRRDGRVGFELTGAECGTGQLDVDALLQAVPDVPRIVEHWLPWQGGYDSTVRKEDRWTGTTVRRLEEHR